MIVIVIINIVNIAENFNLLKISTTLNLFLLNEYEKNKRSQSLEKHRLYAPN